MYKALLDKDTSFEGIFFTAVKTTGIFCRPSCTARKPKKENVEFFTTTKECILRGYRPCKVCRPLENLHQTPLEIQAIMNELQENPSLKFKDDDLRKRGVEPNNIRRWFLKNHGMTFHAYQRMHRINSAFKKIQGGGTITDAAYDSGFDSLSGFGESFKNIFGVAPSKSKEQNVIDMKRIQTPLGTMIACATKDGICLLEFTDRKMLENQLKTLSRQLKAVIVQGNNPHFDCLEKELEEYFANARTHFSVPLHAPGSEFQQKVWNALLEIPYGSTRSYKQQAEAIGNPNGVRAVANANGLNRISILIPCHRVVGSDGQLTGYGGGLWRKKHLLDLEKKHYEEK
jgi:AraC family transcriptional regulator of adaptative response/methylated-DNA-[protein]-cysteine methyltransferase